MSNPSSKQNLSQAVRRIQAVSDAVLNPIPHSLNAQLVSQHDDVLARLVTNEELSGFHPFGDAYLPLPSNGARISEEIKDSNASESNTILNHNLTQLVADVEVTLKSSATSKQDENSASARQGAHYESSNPVSSRPIDRSNANDKLSITKSSGYQSGANDLELSSFQQSDKLLTKSAQDSCSFDGEKSKTDFKSTDSNSSIVAPIFKQLSTLVENWQFGDAVAYLNTDSSQPRKGNQQKPNSGNVSYGQLNVLTEAIVKSRRVETSRSPISSVGTHKRSANRSAASSEANSSTKKQDVSELVRRSANVNSAERVMSSNSFKLKPITSSTVNAGSISGLNELSSMATHKVADALNEYLQEQAELHGVDIS